MVVEPGSRKIFPVIDADILFLSLSLSLRLGDAPSFAAAAFETPAVGILVDSIALLIKYYITALYKKRGRPIGTRQCGGRPGGGQAGGRCVWFEAGSNKPQIRARP